MERKSFDVTDYEWDTEKSSDLGSVSGSSPLTSNLGKRLKAKRISLMKKRSSNRLTSVSGEREPAARLDRQDSTALTALRFISKADGVTVLLAGPPSRIGLLRSRPLVVDCCQGQNLENA
ncbi:unnamed protein product [Brassica rapa subsp. trilocularis]